MSSVPTSLILHTHLLAQEHLQQPPAVSAVTTSIAGDPTHLVNLTVEIGNDSNPSVNFPVNGAAWPVHSDPCL
jgi:hypothetical protein